MTKEELACRVRSLKPLRLRHYLIFGNAPPQPKSAAGYATLPPLSGGVGFNDLTFSGNDILYNSEVLATLTGVDTTTLTSSDFTTV